MVPTAPAHPKHADIDADPVGINSRLGTYTNFVNLLGWCALALPAGFTEIGLPFGVTFIAPGATWRDAALARFGHGWAASLNLPLGATGRSSATATAELPAAWPASRPTPPIAVVGAHLSGLPLNGQLTERGATLREATQTAPHYRLFALPGTTPPKPGLMRSKRRRTRRGHRGRGLGNAAGRGRLVPCVDPAAARPGQPGAGRRALGARLRLRGACPGRRARRDRVMKVTPKGKPISVNPAGSASAHQPSRLTKFV